MGKSPGEKITRGAHCAECRGHRLHEVHVVTEASGRVTRNMTCSACEVVTRLGIACVKCGDVRLKTVTTRHRGGTTVRVRQCRGCGARIRTREILESGNVVPPAPG